MSDNQFGKFVPGFEFLQGLVKNAGSSLPGAGAIGQWVAPTLNPEELGKRIEELRTVQFWLEQNARMLGATIQALEVQRMTLSTLKTMNVPLNDLRDALKVPDFSNMPGMPTSPSSALTAGKKMARKAVGSATKATKAASKAVSGAASTAGMSAGASAIDPTQWWSALTQQFSQVAANAMKDSASEAAKGLAGSLVKQSIDAAGDTLRKAASVPQAVVGGVAGSMAKSLSAQRAQAEASAPKRSAAKVATKAPAKKPSRKR
jgi:hypothetical protein